MRVGASYYPETLPRDDWERDLTTARDLGLSVLRCGEFAWASLWDENDVWCGQWVVDFLDLAARLDFEVVWCSPSATPPPHLFERFSNLQAQDVHGHYMPIGVRRNYCPSHRGYRELCAEKAAQLGQKFGQHPAIGGWQVDNEIAGDGFTCWCERCGGEFQKWLRVRYRTLEILNRAWQTSLWSQVYTRWEQIQVPHKRFGNHTPTSKLAYRRFRSDNWCDFYRLQADALRANGAQRVTTNFYNLSWDMPFDRFKWDADLDARGLSHYLEDDTASRFELAILRGDSSKPVWVLEQKAGQQIAQNLFPEDLGRIEAHLRRCSQNDAEYAIYWHLRQHSAGAEQEHGAVLNHDGHGGRIARVIRDAITTVSSESPRFLSEEAFLVFSFEQEWANDLRRKPVAWSYREEIERHWFTAAREVLASDGELRIGHWREVTSQKWVVAPFLQVAEPRMNETLRDYVEKGGTLVTTADFARLDNENNVRRAAPLDVLRQWAEVPALEILQLQADADATRTLRLFWAIGDKEIPQAWGEANLANVSGPLALRLSVGQGQVILVLTALEQANIAALLEWVREG